MTKTRGDIEVVLFDLGGVIVQLGGVASLGGWIGEPDESAVLQRWIECPWVQRYERGGCTTDEFVAGFLESWELGIPREEFLDFFRAWPGGLYEGAEGLLRELATRVRCACFSNTNDLHWGELASVWRLDGLFERSFLSFQMGMVKPDRDAFLHVVRALGSRPEAVLFLDDNDVNVEGARRAGLVAERARGVDEARGVLAARGLVSR